MLLICIEEHIPVGRMEEIWLNMTITVHTLTWGIQRKTSNKRSWGFIRNKCPTETFAQWQLQQTGEKPWVHEIDDTHDCQVLPNDKLAFFNTIMDDTTDNNFKNEFDQEEYLLLQPVNWLYFLKSQKKIVSSYLHSCRSDRCQCSVISSFTAVSSFLKNLM